MNDEKREKKTYLRPEIRRVKLAPEEAVLAACKTAGNVRRAGYKCDNLQGICINKNQGS